jgi:tetracycline repressor-like protein
MESGFDGTGGAVVTELLAKGWPVRAAVRVRDARSDRLQRRRMSGGEKIPIMKPLMQGMGSPYINSWMANRAFSFAASPSRGRPREFDIDAALDKSVLVFRERGYHATSIADLTGAMELASGSVYKAFKDKAQLLYRSDCGQSRKRR